MNDELVKQRVKYLVEHGGIYPNASRDWKPVLAIVVAVILVEVGFRLLT